MSNRKDFDLEREKDVKEFEEINGKDSEKSRYISEFI